jgi:Fe2+ or Zn2+ uptake regulation protein
MSINSIITELRKQGYRLTPQRLLILQILEEHSGHLSPAQIFEQAAERMPGLTEATVYRTLEFLAHKGLAMVAHIGSGRLVYETTGHDHHHLICRTCGESIQIEHDLLESVYAQVHERTGFQIDCCHVTFFGLCPDCIQA